MLIALVVERDQESSAHRVAMWSLHDVVVRDVHDLQLKHW